MTNEEALALVLERVSTLETAVLNLQKIIDGKGSKRQLRQVLELRQQEIIELKERVSVLETKLSLLGNQ